MVKAQEIKSRAIDLQLDDPGLGLLRPQTEISQQLPKPHQRSLGLLPGTAHHHGVVGEPLTGSLLHG
jgi:hypothetical protein